MAHSLPDDLIFDIISRIPPKNAMQLCCMSKNWHSLLNSSSFRALHFTNFTRRGATSRLWRNLDGDLDIFYLSSERHLNPELSLTPGCRRKCCEDNETVGVINGVVCLSYHPFLLIERIWLWNPITKRILSLSPPQIPSDFVTSDDNDYFQTLGFLYDDARNEYTIVCMSNECDPAEDPIMGNVLLAALSLSSLQWTLFRPPEDFKFAIVNLSPATFLNGAAHWAVYGQRESSTKGCVFSVHASDWSTSVCALPDEIPMEVIIETRVVVIQGCLALIPSPSLAQSVQDGFLYVWIMEDYGDECSWTVRYRIQGEAATWRNQVTLLQSGQILNAAMIHRNRNGELMRVWFCNRINVYPLAQSLELMDVGKPCPRFCLFL